jgi:fatty acid desaturase
MPAKMREPPVHSAKFHLEDSQTRDLLRGMNVAKPRVYWTDLLVTACVGWTAFALALALPPLSAGMVASVAVAALALYRGLCFTHEISHHTSRTLPGFETVWNLLFGYPLLMPSSVYSGVHQNHHSLSTYGTNKDPEYMPFARSSVMTVLFALESFLIPVVLLVRFLPLSVAGIVSPRFQKWLVVYLSSLTMNLEYRREATAQVIRKVRLQSAHILLLWACPLALAATGHLPWRFFALWLAVCSLVSFVNTLRTLGAHAYESSGDPLDRQGQLLDSIDTPGAIWTELWAPVGLRYHALHHYFPGIPYHNLPLAWKKISIGMPDAVYHETRSRGLAYSLWALLTKRRKCVAPAPEPAMES